MSEAIRVKALAGEVKELRAAIKDLANLLDVYYGPGIDRPQYKTYPWLSTPPDDYRVEASKYPFLSKVMACADAEWIELSQAEAKEKGTKK